MKDLDPTSERSVLEYLDRQVRVEDALIQKYIPEHKAIKEKHDRTISDREEALESKTLSKQARKTIIEEIEQIFNNPPISHYPPGFVPIELVISRGPTHGTSHEYLRVKNYKGHDRIRGKDKIFFGGTPKTKGKSKGNKAADLNRLGLIEIGEQSKFIEAVEERFNAGFVDGGNLNQLVSILEGLDEITFELDAFQDTEGTLNTENLRQMGVQPFNGEIAIENDREGQSLQIANYLERFAGPISEAGSHPTFEVIATSPDENGNLPARQMLEFRKALGEGLGIPFGQSVDEIETAWTNQLRVSYNEWKRETKSILKGNGIEANFPTFDQLMDDKQGQNIEIGPARNSRTEL